MAPTEVTRDYPDVVLDITADDSRRDIVAGGFDAGIHFGEYVQKDMIAVRVSKDHRADIVGAPAYFVAPYLASGVLVRVLVDWRQPFPGFLLYYPSRHRQPAALPGMGSNHDSRLQRPLSYR